MPISVTCSCGKVYSLPDDAAGKSGKCKKCGSVIMVPPAVASQSASLGGSGGPVAASETTENQKATGDEIACPSCAENIKAAAVKCRFCGHSLRADPATFLASLKIGGVGAYSVASALVFVCFFAVLYFMVLAPGGSGTNSAPVEGAVPKTEARNEFRALVSKVNSLQALNKLVFAVYNEGEWSIKPERDGGVPAEGLSNDIVTPDGQSAYLRFLSDDFNAETGEGSLVFFSRVIRGFSTDPSVAKSTFFRYFRCGLYYDGGWRVDKVEMRRAFSTGINTPPDEEFTVWERYGSADFVNAMDSVISE